MFIATKTWCTITTNVKIMCYYSRVGTFLLLKKIQKRCISFENSPKIPQNISRKFGEFLCKVKEIIELPKNVPLFSPKGDENSAYFVVSLKGNKICDQRLKWINIFWTININSLWQKCYIKYSFNIFLRKYSILSKIREKISFQNSPKIPQFPEDF